MDKVIICGSGAAEGIPAYFCGCRVCREAARAGGKDIRMRASYNFGGAIHVDFGPDALQAFHRHREAMSGIRHILVTHGHEDHISPPEFSNFRDGFCTVPTFGDFITVHCARPTIDRFERELLPRIAENREETVYRRCRIRLHETRPFDVFELPDVGATVRTFKANHDGTLDPMVFVVTMSGRTVFFCNDTGYLPEESWRALAAMRGQFKIDLAILDNTGGLKGWRDGHMGSEAVLDTFARLAEIGLADSSMTRVVNHFSHNCESTHSELVKFYGPLGIIVGYDGLEL